MSSQGKVGTGSRAFAAMRGLAILHSTLVIPVATSTAGAQTDYYNTDAGRPIRVEDAYPIERRAIELQLAPMRLERSRGAAYSWGIEPEVAFGLLARTQVEIGFPLIYSDLTGGRSEKGLAGIELSALYNLNVETSIPALAVAAETTLPVGALGPQDARFSLKSIATKTFSSARFHINGQYTFGRRGGSFNSHGDAEFSRWLGGLAVDRTFPLRSLLVTGEIVVRQPGLTHSYVEWQTGAGVRYQLSPRLAIDGGAGYELNGNRNWSVTFGAALTLGLPWSAR